MARDARLNEKQVEVLRWIAEGCPPGRWDDHRYKNSAVALQNRGLVVVSKKRGSWSAALTDEGRRYLADGRSRQAPVARHSQAERKAVETSYARPARHRVEAADLLERLRAAGGQLRLEDPAPAVRAGYRRAISAAITSGGVPDGYRLRHTGRDRGDLIIRLVAAEEDPARREPRPPPIPIPETVGSLDQVVRGLGETLDGKVSVEQRPRALRIAQGIAEEARRRSHGFTERPDGTPGFRISIGEDDYDFALWEEQDKADRFPEEAIAAAKYPWQRVSAKSGKFWSGRLVLQLGDGYRPPQWADRKRWTLVDKLPEVLALIEDLAQAARGAREQAQAAARRRREEWEAAVPQARQAYLAELNRQRVIDQAEGWRRADDLRRFAAEVRSKADQTVSTIERQRLAAWVEWARREADRLDPMRSPETLGFHTPEEIDAAELDAYMPPGMTVRHPPETPAGPARWSQDR